MVHFAAAQLLETPNSRSMISSAWLSVKLASIIAGDVVFASNLRRFPAPLAADQLILSRHAIGRMRIGCRMP